MYPVPEAIQLGDAENLVVRAIEIPMATPVKDIGRGCPAGERIIPLPLWCLRVMRVLVLVVNLPGSGTAAC